MVQDPRISRLLHDIFGLDFKQFKGNPENLKAAFYSHDLTLFDLRQVFNLINASELSTPFPDEPTRSITIPASILIGKPDATEAVLCLSQVHGNEPVGLSVMLFAMAMAEADLLRCKVYGAIGNDSAARYYWEAYEDNPDSPPYLRANTRTLVGEEEKIDLNRFLPERAVQARENRNKLIHMLLASDNVMLRRGAKLCSIACLPEVEMIFDPHTSRQEPDGIRTINISGTQLARLEHAEGHHAGLLRGVPRDIRVFPAGLLGN
ncbi:MAG: hypothetical protein EB060_05135, partial [Proteobacteria bacterium]|nr:hypothetical protein [Pseudomonadota bacterium]